MSTTEDVERMKRIEKLPHCLPCKRAFSAESLLITHNKLYHGVKKLTCGICQTTFSSRRNFHMHIKTVHELSVEQCKECGLEFDSKIDLNHHVKSHRKDKVYPCDTCEQTSSTKVNQETHSQHHDVESIPTCQICQLTFKTTIDLYKHVSSHSDWKLKSQTQTHDKPSPRMIDGVQHQVVEAQEGVATGEQPHITKQENTLGDQVPDGMVKLLAPTENVTKSELKYKEVDPQTFRAKPPLGFVVVHKNGVKTFQVIRGAHKSLEAPSILSMDKTETDTVGEPITTSTDNTTGLEKSPPSSSIRPTSTIETQTKQLSCKDFEKDELLSEFLISERTNAERQTRKVNTISEKLEELKKANETLEASVSNYCSLKMKNSWQNGTATKLNPVTVATENIQDPNQAFRERYEKLPTDTETLAFVTDVAEINNALDPITGGSQSLEECSTINYQNIHKGTHLLGDANIAQAASETKTILNIQRSSEDLDNSNEEQRMEGLFTCKVCSEVFDDPCVLSLHMTVHTVIGENLVVREDRENIDKGVHSCIMCEKTFISQECLNKHLADHYDKIVLNCRDCDQVFHGLTELREHQKTCTKIEIKKEMEGINHPSSKCSICGKKYSGNEDEEAHMQVHEKLHAPTCLTCGQHFDTASMLNIHMEVMNHSQAEFFWCDTCNQMIHNSVGRELHMEQHRNQQEEEPTEACETCGGHFTDLKSHILEEHVVNYEANNVFACTTCGDEFDTSSMLEIHKEIMKHGQTKPEENVRSGLVLQGPVPAVPQHEQSKLFNCSECDKVFRTSGALRLHKLKHSKETKELCRVCGRFVTNLKTHMQTHNKITLPFKCEVCGKGFLHKSRMEFHMRIHSFS